TSRRTCLSGAGRLRRERSACLTGALSADPRETELVTRTPVVQVHVEAMQTTIATPQATDPLDFLAIDALLSDEDPAIRGAVRAWVRDRIMPEVGTWFEQGILPRELAQEVGQLGLFGMHLEGYGLPGASAVAYGLACMELEAGDSGVRSFVSVQGSLAMF